AVGIGQTILRPRFLHFQRRHAQIPVIHQRLANQRLHLIINKKGAPARVLIVICCVNESVLAELELLRHW
ncbi:hypothetical protein Q604_UNBC06446G0001, partial [human gut metagenome]